MCEEKETTDGIQRHLSAEQRKRSAVVLAKTLLQELPGLLPEHRRECLGIALWKYTEAEGVHKHKTRFRSKASLSASSADLRHDHVFQRATMIEALIRAGEKGVEEIIRNAVGCAITKAEHTQLNEFKHLDGWERYRRAGIEVIDTETETQLNFEEWGLVGAWPSLPHPDPLLPGEERGEID